MRLLMIDDDEILAEVISQHLIKQHYAVDIATTGQMGLEFVSLFDYDLIILDLMLPDLNGRQLCTRIRQNKHQMPILMLTAKDDAEDKIKGLDAGADDYLVKPIHLPELLARVRALLRRSSPMISPQLHWGALTLDPSTFETTFNGQIVALTPKEYSILELFLRNPQKSQTLDGIIDNIWALESPPSLYAIRTHIKSLRQKLKAMGAPKDFIETLYGFGYRLNPNCDISPATEESKASSSSVNLTVSTSQLDEMTQDLWFKHKGEMDARVDVLETIAEAVQSQSLTAELKQEGIILAHKLAGSLGCFGFQDGSQFARKIERSLKENATFTSHQRHEIHLWVRQLRDSINVVPSTTIVEQHAPRLLVYSNDAQFIQQLIDHADYGFAIASVFEGNAFLSQVETHPPSLIVLDLENPDQSLATLSKLKEIAPDIPVMAILHGGEWLDRIDYIQHGASQVFQAPVGSQEILEAAHQIYSSTHARAKILIVDDDCSVLSMLEASLGGLGFEVSTLSNTLNFLDMLKRTKPDVVVLDVEMPEVNGLELCQVLRADPRWAHLPVIFLSAHKDPQTEDHAFVAGADDFIPKNFPMNRLVLRIQNRLR